MLTGVLIDPVQAAQIEFRGTVASAVLVALYEADGELHTLFTERRLNLSRHAGEISFPGGRRDPEDADLVATALREAHEEIGLPPDAVTVIGALQPTATIATGYAIYPFVGRIEPGHVWVPSEAEVKAVLEYPLSVLRGVYARRRIIRRGMPIWTDTYAVGEHVIWGATARILSDLLERLQGAAAA